MRGAQMSAHAPPIHRRDFLNGAALALAGLDAGAAPEAGYPPARTGLQGHTDALAAPAHRLRQRDHTWREDAAERDEGMQDLVVVGAGISGLTGAWLFQRHAGAPVRILILDALDDIGGHARRNEFTARNGVLRVGHGGSQSLESPSQFSPAVKQVLADVGVQYQRFESEFFDQGWAARQGLQRSALFFGQREWGEDRIVLREPKEEAAQWLARTPLSASAQADWLRLLDKRFNPLPGLTRAARRSLLSRLTYNRYLEHHAHIGPEVRSALWQDSLGYFGAGADAVSALDAFAGGLVGFAGLDLGTDVDPRMSASGRLNLVSEDKYIYHFPDGNHGLATGR